MSQTLEGKGFMQDLAEDKDDLWVFGYGSLMWRPGFAHCEAHTARIIGFQRTFCIYSTHHRGNDIQPGLVLGLDRGGFCDGMAFRISAALRDDTLRYLRAREQISGVYRETKAYIQLLRSGGETRSALAYVVEVAHPSYAGRLPFQRQLQIIRAAHGRSGPNVEYLINTSMHLRELSIRDRNMERLASAAGGLFATSFDRPEVLHRRSACLAKVKTKRVVAGPKLHPPDRRRFLYRNRVGSTG